MNARYWFRSGALGLVGAGFVAMLATTRSTQSDCIDAVRRGYAANWRGYALVGEPAVLREWAPNRLGLIEVRLRPGSEGAHAGKSFYCTVSAKGDLWGISDEHPDPGAADLRR